jgi:hypothetical protein
MRVASDVFSRNSPHSDGGNDHSYRHHSPRVSNRLVKLLESRELASL